MPKKPSRHTTERAFIYPSPCTGSAVRRTEEAFPSSRFRSLSQLVIPRQPGKCRLRMASGHITQPDFTPFRKISNNIL